MCVFIEYIPRSRISQAQGWQCVALIDSPFFKMVVCQQGMGVLADLHPRLTSSVFFILAILLDAWWYLMILKCNFKMLITFSWVYWTLVPCFKKII